MKLISLSFLAAFLFSCSGPAPKTSETNTNVSPEQTQTLNKGDVDFSQWFQDKTMRLDFFHTGSAQEEVFAVDKALCDGVWSGSHKILIDKLELGPYFFEVIDKETKTLLFSRGFASIFGEWQTTPEADKVKGTFHESLRFPWPQKPQSS